jgi:arginine/ornithine N-succinyltransferase beta subunit
MRQEAGALEPWRVHDLRRTLATGLQRLGVRFEVTEAVLNHVSGARSGVAGIYQRHDWREEKRTALEAWARHVAVIIQPADTGNVIQLSAAKGAA